MLAWGWGQPWGVTGWGCGCGGWGITTPFSCLPRAMPGGPPTLPHIHQSRTCIWCKKSTWRCGEDGCEGLLLRWLKISPHPPNHFSFGSACRTNLDRNVQFVETLWECELFSRLIATCWAGRESDLRSNIFRVRCDRGAVTVAPTKPLVPSQMPGPRHCTTHCARLPTVTLGYPVRDAAHVHKDMRQQSHRHACTQGANREVGEQGK